MKPWFCCLQATWPSQGPYLPLPQFTLWYNGEGGGLTGVDAWLNSCPRRSQGLLLFVGRPVLQSIAAQQQSAGLLLGRLGRGPPGILIITLPSAAHPRMLTQAPAQGSLTVSSRPCLNGGGFQPCLCPFTLRYLSPSLPIPGGLILHV